MGCFFFSFKHSVELQLKRSNNIPKEKNNVSIKRLVQNPYKSKKISSIVIITHNSKDKFLRKIFKEISRKKYIKKKPKLMRIDND